MPLPARAEHNPPAPASLGYKYEIQELELALEARAGGWGVQAPLFSAAPTQGGSVVLSAELSGLFYFSLWSFFKLPRGNVKIKGVGFGKFIPEGRGGIKKILFVVIKRKKKS